MYQRTKVLRACVLSLAAFAAFIATIEAHAQESHRPNIIVLLIDDLRWDELSFAGHPVVRTPNIDRIAREGVRFRNAFATTPLCSPVRACLLTGQYTHNHGILDNINRSEQSHRLKTFPILLQQAGYNTAYVGKWHMGNDDTARPGFDHWVSMKGQGISRNPMINLNGKRVKEKGHTTDVLNRHAVEFVNRQDEKPFCLYIAHKALHPELTQYDDGSISDPSAAKFIPADRHQDLYKDAPVPRRLNVTDSLAGKPALQRKIGDLPSLSKETGTPDETVRDRWRMLAACDDGVGKLFAALEKREQLDDTIIVFASDHGYWYGEHGLSVERRLAYEEAIRVPLLVRYPRKFAAGGLRDELALSIDLAPTLLELAGVSIPAYIDGRSLVPLLSGDSPADWRTSFLIEYNTDTVFPRVYKMGYKAIRTERYKYIRYNELEDMDELYDLANDPYEMHNVIDDRDSRATLKLLQSELEKFVSRAQ
ncbi:MAG: acetylglucosamine-6-sulfatase [Planctomycetaceae bacterium]|nr:acetylglucosamine-6-sulfatase [Planctomycetaceae bacterium]